jgi:glucose-1-phosphate thymidylyltransferase
MKGVVLAGGTGSRLWPITLVNSKQLIPVYDKPMIYYPISTLMNFGVREILIITTPKDKEMFQELLGDGSKWGIEFEYRIQERPVGIADSLIVAESFLDNQSVLLVLGDNLFHANDLNMSAITSKTGSTIFCYTVSDPSAYGVLEMDLEQRPVSIEEKPTSPKSNLAITGLYFFDSDASARAKKVRPSARGELEITSLIESYRIDNLLKVHIIKKGGAWLDSGTPVTLNDASNYVHIIEERTGVKVGCPEEIAFKNKWIDVNQLGRLAESYKGSEYGRYLTKLLIIEGA